MLPPIRISTAKPDTKNDDDYGLMDMIQDTVLKYVPGLRRARSLNWENGIKCNMTDNVTKSVMRSMMVAKIMLDMWIQTEIKEEIPSPIEVCQTVSRCFHDDSEEDDDVKKIVSEKLIKVALEMWNVAQSSNYIEAVKVGKDGKCEQ